MNLSITFLAIILISNATNGQTIKFNKETGKAHAQEVIESPKSATDLYAIAKRWVMTSFTNPDKVISGTMENELIKGTGSCTVKIGFLVDVPMTYSFTIDVKDNKTRITITDYIIRSTAGTYSFETYVYKNDGTVRNNSQASNLLKSSEPVMQSLIDSYKGAVLNDAVKKNDDW